MTGTKVHRTTKLFARNDLLKRPQLCVKLFAGLERYNKIVIAQ